ncbi:putative Zinc finger, RING/FYVE/PHD-type, Zinc finger, C3HC4 RING-type [Helianthus annuus]|nr:putative Zinc finger, RING/FYVE/PHD-type, Zinc finger, C3HC4 RING-type [Helianthus annuus]
MGRLVEQMATRCGHMFCEGCIRDVQSERLMKRERQATGRWLFNRRKRRTSINHNNKTKVVDQVFVIKYLRCSLVAAQGRPNIRRHL